MRNETEQTMSAAGVSRRTFAAAGLALGAFAALFPLGGCALLGIEEPEEEEEEPEEEALPAGAVDFEGLVVAPDTDPANWQWLSIDNPNSAYNGCLVVGVPVTVTNNDTSSRVLSALYCSITGPNGIAQQDISVYYTGDDVLQRGGIPAGTTTSAVLHVLYQGAGTYTVSFDDLLGHKAHTTLEVGSASASGLHPIPNRLGQQDVNVAVTYGLPFDVSGLTFTFSSDESLYSWEQSWDETNPGWNGQWCVGVPVTITNNATTAHAFTAEQYGLYAPDFSRTGDPAPYFQAASACYLPAIEPGQTVQSKMYWPYYGDGWYYAVFDNNGTKAVASVHIMLY